jgi:hypothetical protein
MRTAENCTGGQNNIDRIFNRRTAEYLKWQTAEY